MLYSTKYNISLYDISIQIPILCKVAHRIACPLYMCPKCIVFAVLLFIETVAICKAWLKNKMSFSLEHDLEGQYNI